MNLLEIRKRKGYNQEELSKLTGISRPFISQIETGKHFPSIKKAQALAKALGCTIDELLADEEVNETELQQEELK